MQLFKHKLSLVNQVLRLFQIVGAVACVFYYGRIIAKADKDDTYHDSKWMYAVVVASMALVTSFVYFVCGFVFEFRAFAILATWDGILTLLWTVVAGIFGTMYWKEKPEMDPEIKRMKVAAGFDIANVLLWLLTMATGVYRHLIAGTQLLHNGRGRRAKKTTTTT